MGSFDFLNIFAWHGTIFRSVIPQMLFFLLWSFFICSYQNKHPMGLPDSWKDIYSAIGFFLGFLLSARVGNSLSLNGKALTLIGNIRGACRKMVKASCNYKLNTSDPAKIKEVTRLRLSIRRHCDIMWAFMRQHLRESRDGFHPKSDMANVEFGPDTYMDDPCRPLLCERLTEQEMVYYANMSTGARVTNVARSLSAEIHALAQYFDCVGEYASNSAGFCDLAIAKFSACCKIFDETLPFVYKHALYNLLFLYALITPLVQIQKYDGELSDSQTIMTVCVSTLVAGVYFGVMFACARLCGPFGWDPNDMDLEHIGLQIVAQGNRVTGTAVGGPCKYVPGVDTTNTELQKVAEGSLL